MVSFGRRLMTAMTYAGVDTYTLATESYTEKSKLYAYRRDERLPDQETLAWICRALEARQPGSSAILMAEDERQALETINAWYRRETGG